MFGSDFLTPPQSMAKHAAGINEYAPQMPSMNEFSSIPSTIEILSHRIKQFNMEDREEREEYEDIVLDSVKEPQEKDGQIVGTVVMNKVVNFSRNAEYVVLLEWMLYAKKNISPKKEEQASDGESDE